MSGWVRERAGSKAAFVLQGVVYGQLAMPLQRHCQQHMPLAAHYTGLQPVRYRDSN